MRWKTASLRRYLSLLLLPQLLEEIAEAAAGHRIATAILHYVMTILISVLITNQMAVMCGI